MEYCEGGFINDLEYLKQNNISTKEVCEKLGLLYSKMIFDHGFVHCDPHPGNIIVKGRGDGSVELSLLDHGLYTVSLNCYLIIILCLYNIYFVFALPGIIKGLSICIRPAMAEFTQL